MVDDNDNILIMGKPNNVCISVKDIPLLGKRGLGNILIKGSTISKITKIFIFCKNDKHFNPEEFDDD